MKTQQRQRPIKQRPGEGAGRRLPERRTQIHVLARVMHHVGAPDKTHTVLGPVVPVKNEIDHHKGEHPPPHRVRHFEHAELIEKEMQADQRAANGEAHEAVNAQLRHRAEKILECIGVAALRAGVEHLRHHQ